MPDNREYFKFATAETLPPEFLEHLHERRAPEMFALQAAPQALSDQFIVFQLNKAKDGPTILETSRVDPDLEGSDAEPDVRAELEMLAFNVGQNEDIDPNTRATMRINLGKDPSSTDKYFDVATWAVAAGLNLWDESKGKRAEGNQLKGNLSDPFRNTPIQIPGALGRFSVEVVKHREPKWWQKVFKFATGDTGRRLVSLLGFPALATEAMGAVDELLNRLFDDEPDVLFSSRPMQMALTKRAKKALVSGNERFRVPSLSPGVCVMARARDFSAIAGSNSVYDATFEKLIPADLPPDKLYSGRFDDPLANVTYAIFRVGLGQTKLQPTVSFGQ